MHFQIEATLAYRYVKSSNEAIQNAQNSYQCMNIW